MELSRLRSVAQWSRNLAYNEGLAVRQLNTTLERELVPPMKPSQKASPLTAEVDNLTPPLTAETERQLLQRLYVVQEWMQSFAISLGHRKPPRLKTWFKGAMGYAPLRNTLMVPCRHLLSVSDQHLRIAVAHEMGHFSRRWPSLLSWTLIRRVEEELHADRCALELSGASIGDWEDSIQAVAAIEAPGERHDDDIIFQTRKELLQRWIDCQRIS